MPTNPTAIILRNEIADSDLKWRLACEKINLDYVVIDISSADWLEQILAVPTKLLLTRPAGLTMPFKILYDERLEILVRDLGYFAYPNLLEVKIYENKKYFAYWLKANKIPHPETFIFYHREEAHDWAKKLTSFPVVGKTNIGASGSGVKILKSASELEKYIDSTFSGGGGNKRVGPNLKKGRLVQRAVNLLLKPQQLKKKVKVYQARALDVQKDFVLFQGYVPHTFEWRVVRIGDSFFAHKKMMLGEMTSGSLIKDYGNPPLQLFDFVKQLTDKFGLFSQAVDVFEHPTEKFSYLVNEMQCIFGQSDAYQMQVDGIIGRYIWKQDKWFFEAGDFNTNESYDLRLETALKMYHQQVEK